MSAFEGMTKEEIQAAQDRLDELCHSAELQTFDIRHTGFQDKNWRALILKLCGVNATQPKSRGRPEDRQTGNIGVKAYIDTEFCDTDFKTGKKLSREEIFDRIIREENITPKKTAHGFTDPRNTVKKALGKVRKGMKEYEQKKRPASD